MSAPAYTRRLITIVVDGTIFTLKGWHAHKVALGAGLRPIFNGVRGAWVADTKKLPELVAYCEWRNIAVSITGDTQERPLAAARANESGAAAGESGTDMADSPVQLSLFGGDAS